MDAWIARHGMELHNRFSAATVAICGLGGLSYLNPQSTFGAHASAAPHAQTLRTTPLSTRGNVSFFGYLGYELDLKH